MRSGNIFLKRNEIVFVVILSALLLVVFPMALDSFRLNLVGKYLTYAFVALGLVLCWGNAGILSLGQGSSSVSAATAWRCS